MELFADLRDAGYFNGSHEYQCLLRYCFGDVIQKDFEECVRDCGTVTGFALPEQQHVQEECPMNSRFGSRDCGFQVEQAELDALPEATLSMTPCGDPNLQEYLDFAMEHNQIQKLENWESASELYMKLKEIAQL